MEQRRARLKIKVKFMKNKIFKKEKTRIHGILRPINTIMQIKKAVNPPFKVFACVGISFCFFPDMF